MTDARQALFDIIHEDGNVTGEAALWASVLSLVVQDGRRGNHESVRRFIRDGPLDVAAFALQVHEEKLKTLLMKESRGAP